MHKSKNQLYVPVDLAAVCSVAFILLLLYLSMAGFKAEEPVRVNMPETSGYRCTMNGLGDAVILLGEGKVFLRLPDTVRKDVLLQMSNKYNTRFTKSQCNRFKNIEFIGISIAAFHQEVLPHDQSGISLQGKDNELAAWISAASKTYRTLYQRDMQIGIKADKDTRYTLIKDVITVLQNQNINRFSFITATKVKHD